nr:hypothetical protein BaRGS_006503 [Batillaria attramentaria]
MISKQRERDYLGKSLGTRNKYTYNFTSTVKRVCPPWGYRAKYKKTGLWATHHPPGFARYLGCWHDKGTDSKSDYGRRKIDRRLKNYDVRNCIARCWEMHYKYALLKEGNKCICTRIMTSFQPDIGAHCHLPCANDKTYVCGGKTHVSAFHTGYIAPPVFTHITDDEMALAYIGCFENWETFCAGFNFTSKRMGVPLCLTVCEQQLTTLAGLMRRELCCCGSTMAGMVNKPDRFNDYCYQQCHDIRPKLVCGSSSKWISLYSTALLEEKKERMEEEEGQIMQKILVVMPLL